jgi:uncharacterized membrane protein
MKLNKFLSLPSILIQFGILTFFSFYLFPKYHEPIKAAASKPYQTLDVTIGYDKTYMIDLFETIGEEGKKQYARVEKEIDVLFPILYTLFFYSLIKYLSLNTSSKTFFDIAPFVIIGAFADLSENAIILHCLNSDPNEVSTNLISLCSILTITKYTVIVLSTFTCIFLFIKILIQRLKFSFINN